MPKITSGSIRKRVLIGGLGLLVALCSIILLFLHVRNNPPPDQLGNTPKAVVENFIEAVCKRRYSDAIEYVSDEVPRIMLQGSGLAFEDYCVKRFDCDSYELSGPIRGKPGDYFIEYKGESKGESESYLFALELIDCEWKIVL